MKIVIVGDGKVGSTLAQQLSQEMHDIVVIDNDAGALNHSIDQMDVMGIVGNGASYAVQQEAGVDRADVLIAATSSDERNLICCMVAKNLGAKRTIARVRNPEYSQQMHLLKEELGLSLCINPELAAAGEISRILRCPAATKIHPFARGRAELVDFSIDENSPLAGMPLHRLKSAYRCDLLVCAVLRGEEVFIPDGAFVLAAHDKISVVAAPRQVNSFFDKISLARYKVKDVMIAGGSRIAYYLARQLGEMGVRVRIIDNDPARCRELCELLPDTRVLLGDASDQELLQEEGIEQMDAFVTLTGYDEVNIILSMYASACRVPKVITKVNSVTFPGLMEKIGLDIVISPKALTADVIVGYVRAMQNSEGSAMETMYKLLGGRMEALDFHVRAGDHPILGIPLKDLHTKAQTLIACIVRDGRTIIPNGQTTIEKGDHVILLTGNGMLRNLKDVLA
nr:Trk system potassium transporter TrkA [Maliibacterium massiliense]